MAFVPIVPSSPSVPPSPRTRELATLLSKVLEEYARTHPAVTKAEIRAAMRMVQMSGGSNTPLVAGLVSLVVGLVALALFGFFFFRSGGDVEIGSGFPMIVVAVIVLLAILMFAIRARS